MLSLLLLGAQRPVVSRCTLTGTVDNGSADHLAQCVRRATAEGHEALLVRVDTPGGSLEATRTIVQSFLSAKVPVLVFVGPPGARAASAGTFLVLASHLSAMAPGTVVGAAHPVSALPLSGEGDGDEQVMAQKVVNDTAAFAAAVARQRGRNVTWAEDAVRRSASVPAEQAIELNVAEILASDEADFLGRADGLTVAVGEERRQLRTAGAAIVDLRPTLGQKVVHALANPALAYLLFLLGMLGLGIELAHPGMIVPGLLGATCLVLAFIAFSALPIAAGGVALLVLGVAFLFAEVFVTSGLLGAVGALLLVLGGVLLVDRFSARWFVEPGFGVPLRLILPAAITFALLASFLVARVAEARRLPQRAGDLGLIGEHGQAVSPVTPQGGEVFVHGERWRAVSGKPIPPDRPVVVRHVEGLTLQVEEVFA